MKPLGEFLAEQILAIPMEDPERLFSVGSEDAIKTDYHSLAMRWHPDRNSTANAKEVFEHIGELHRIALGKIKRGEWHTPGLLQLHGSDGKLRKIRYFKRHYFELGEMYIADTVITYVIRDKANRDLFGAAQSTIEGFKFANSKMEKEVRKYLPEIVRTFETDDALVMIVKKREDEILLRDLLDHLGGKVDQAQVAWIISSALNIACYLKYAGLSHSAISLDSFWVSMTAHSGSLLGGWWHATKIGKKLLAVPNRTLLYAPADVLTKKLGDLRVDLALIRALGRELLGDANGTRLSRDKKLKAPMVNWLRYAGSGDAMKEYAEWKSKILPSSFGAPRFVKLDISPSEVYKE